MGSPKITWQVGELTKHSIPDGAKVTFVHKVPEENTLAETTFWIDENGELTVDSRVSKGESK